MSRSQTASLKQLHDVEVSLRALFLEGLDGNAEAYHVCLLKLSGHLRAFLAKRLFGWPDDVEDLVQESLLAMHNQRHTYQPDQPLTAWAYAIARYKMIDLLRAKQIKEGLHDPIDDESQLFVESHTEASDARRDVSGLLQTLPDRQRLPIMHVKLQGLSVAETAALTGMSESAVKVGIHRGLKALAVRVKGTA